MDLNRYAIRFELVPLGGLDMDIDIDSLEDATIDELREIAEASVSSGSPPTTDSSSRTTYRRSEVVKQYAFRVADGVCYGCGDDAPFVDTGGKPFLEVHHLRRRSDGGPDHPDNVIALCPNCHRRVHYGEDGDAFNQKLIERDL